MGMPDQHFDAVIQSALQQGTNVSSQQKQFAWERLSAAVEQQTMLPPLEMTGNVSLMERMYSTSGTVWRWIYTLAIDEGLYERARRSRYAVQYYGLPHSGQLSFQMLEPLRLNSISPVF